jgi:hypothetical protein
MCGPRLMDKDEITAWALANGWQMLAGHPSLTNETKPKDPIVRLVFKATVVALEIKKPAGKWEKMGGAGYSDIQPDPESGVPRGLGIVSISGITKLMRENKDRQVFARFK